MSETISNECFHTLFWSSMNMAEAGFMTYTSTFHQVVIQKLWLHFWLAVNYVFSTIFFNTHIKLILFDYWWIIELYILKYLESEKSGETRQDAKQERERAEWSQIKTGAMWGMKWKEKYKTHRWHLSRKINDWMNKVASSLWGDILLAGIYCVQHAVWNVEVTSGSSGSLSS